MTSVPWATNLVANFPLLLVRTGSDYSANDFVAWNSWESAPTTMRERL